MKKVLTIVLTFFIFLSISTTTYTYAAMDPLSVPNNKVGVHILFPSEVEQAARIINTNGDWGYITIPIQSHDKDLDKWQIFMNQCSKFHLIPIIRLATEGDYFKTSSWRKPTYADVLDFANFLSSLTWPTKIHYIVVYNEVNRNDEWGDKANPIEYANILSYAVTAFKAKDPNFFVMNAGLDNAAANSSAGINEYAFLLQMQTAVPGIFNQIDGIVSHSYPNPGFSSSPVENTRESIQSFLYESSLIDSISAKKLPIFITETGWSRDSLNDSTIAAYYETAFKTIWNNDRVVAVTPFLLFAASEPFLKFSLLNTDLSNTLIANLIQSLPKISGKPEFTQIVLAAESVKKPSSLPTVRFGTPKPNLITETWKKIIRSLFITHTW